MVMNSDRVQQSHVSIKITREKDKKLFHQLPPSLLSKLPLFHCLLLPPRFLVSVAMTGGTHFNFSG